MALDWSDFICMAIIAAIFLYGVRWKIGGIINF